MSKAKPLAGIKLKENRILIQRFGVEEKSEGGIILMKDEQEAPEGGLVVSVGPTVNGIEVGEKVRYYEHGTEVEIGGEDYYLLRDSDVWGEIE